MFFALNIVLNSIETALTDFVPEVNFLTSGCTDFFLKPVRDHFANNCEAKDLEYEAMWYVTNYILNLFIVGPSSCLPTFYIQPYCTFS
jgi:hypothetical protein